MKDPTPRVVRVVERAERLADSYGHDSIGTEHLMLSLTIDEGGLASQVLDDLDVRAKVAARLRAIIESGLYRARE